MSVITKEQLKGIPLGEEKRLLCAHNRMHFLHSSFLVAIPKEQLRGIPLGEEKDYVLRTECISFILHFLLTDS